VTTEMVLVLLALVCFVGCITCIALAFNDRRW
jgi:hypothetical protein